MGLMNENEITESTTLRVLIRVVKSDGTPKNLGGATFTASLGRSGISVNAVPTVVTPGDNLVQIIFPPAVGMKGFVTGTLHMTVSGETQCIWRERFQVFPNLE